MGFPCGLEVKASACNAGDLGSIPESGRSPGEGNLPGKSHGWSLVGYSPIGLGLHLPCSSVGKESACSVGDLGSIPGLGRSFGEGNGNPLQLLLLGKSHGQKSPVDYSLWGHKDSDMSEQTHMHPSLYRTDL